MLMLDIVRNIRWLSRIASSVIHNARLYMIASGRRVDASIYLSIPGVLIAWTLDYIRQPLTCIMKIGTRETLSSS